MDRYNRGKYFQAVPVIEHLISLYKGTDTGEMLYFTLAEAYFKNDEFLVAAYHYKNYRELYSTNPKAEDALFKSALCYYYESPRHPLDQTETKNAIDNLQLFINEYPNSSKIPEGNIYMAKLRRKLELKAYDAAKLYFRTQNYRAAGVSFRNLIKEFPDIAEAEEAVYLATKSDFYFAENSVSYKQPERFIQASQSANEFYNKYPSSTYTKEIQEIQEKAYFYTIKSAYDWGQSAFFDKRIEGFNAAIDNYRDYFSNLKSPSDIEKANMIVEKAYQNIVKTNYDLGEEAKSEGDKRSRYEAAVKAYLLYIEKYPNRASKDLEAMYLKASEKLKL